MRKNYCFATWIRAFSAVLILFTHYVGENSSAYLKHMGGVFVTGVDIFLILSGFLFGTKQDNFESNTNIFNWYKKRFKRIYIPLELFFTVLLGAYIAVGDKILPINWIVMALGMRGFFDGIKLTGAGHTWFITAILLCYLITPLLWRLNSWIDEKNDRKITAVLAACGGGYNPDFYRSFSDAVFSF